MWNVQKSGLEKMSGSTCVCVCMCVRACKTSENKSFWVLITQSIELKFGVHLKQFSSFFYRIFVRID